MPNLANDSGGDYLAICIRAGVFVVAQGRERVVDTSLAQKYELFWRVE